MHSPAVLTVRGGGEGWGDEQREYKCKCMTFLLAQFTMRLIRQLPSTSANHAWVVRGRIEDM